jgi:hypothetical protein
VLSYTAPECPTRLITRSEKIFSENLFFPPPLCELLANTGPLARVYLCIFVFICCLLVYYFFLLGIGVPSALEALVTGPSSSETIFAMCPIFVLKWWLRKAWS